MFFEVLGCILTTYRGEWRPLLCIQVFARVDAGERMIHSPALQGL